MALRKKDPDFFAREYKDYERTQTVKKLIQGAIEKQL